LTQAELKASTVQSRALDLLGAAQFMPVCFAVYMAVRIAAVLVVQPLKQTSDFAWYYGRAVGIAAGSGYAEHGILTAFWPVGWPGFLGALFAITGPSELVGQIANLVFSAVVFAMTAALATALFRDRLIGRAAVLLLTLYPNQIGWIPMLSTEIFYEMLLLLCIWLLAQERVAPALLSGLLFGLAMLTKTQSLLIPGFLYLGVFLAAPSLPTLRRLVGQACVVYVAMILVVAPWTYRNYMVFGAFIPVSTNGGFTLLTGNNPEANGDYVENTSLAQGLSHDPADQVAMDRLASQRAVAWIKANPVAFIELLPRKLFRLWAPDGESEWYYQRGYENYDRDVVAFRTVRVFNQAYYVGLLLLALPSLWLLRRRSQEISPWATGGLSMIVYFSLLSMIFSGQSRFHACLMPFIAMYSAWTLVRLFRGGRLVI
jgi:hypothetical protein